MKRGNRYASHPDEQKKFTRVEKYDQMESAGKYIRPDFRQPTQYEKYRQAIEAIKKKREELKG